MNEKLTYDVPVVELVDVSITSNMMLNTSTDNVESMEQINGSWG